MEIGKTDYFSVKGVIGMDALSVLTGLVERKQARQDEKFCPCCEGEHIRLQYSMLGYYSCGKCGYTELDMYGKLRYILELNPSLTRIEICSLLGISLRELEKYVDEQNHLINPRENVY